MASGPALQDRNIRRLALRLTRYALRRWVALLGVAATMLLDVAMNLLRPWPMAIVIDSVLSDRPLHGVAETVFGRLPGAGSSEGLLEWAVVATVVIFMLGWVLDLAKSYTSISFGRKMAYDLAGDLLQHLQALSLRYHSGRGVGDLFRRVTTDSACVGTIVQDGLLPILGSVVALVSVLTVMFGIDPVLTGLAFIVLPWFVIVLRRLSDRMAMADWEAQEADSRIYDEVEQTLSGIQTVQAFTRENLNDEVFATTTRAALVARVRATSVQLRFKVGIGLGTAFGTAAVMWLGAEHVLSGSLSVGAIVVLLSYVESLYVPVETLMYTPATVQGAAGSVYRVMEVLEAAPDVVDAPHAPSLPPVRGHVHLQGVAFGYDPTRPVLKGVDMEAHPGETVAVVGTTGAGKSTLLSLVSRFYDPQHGVVSIDGHDLRTVRLATVRSQVALVSQESFLFPISIADNIAYGRPGASREEIVRAAIAANADEFIREMADGYETVVGERGATLSGGQRQRVAIARALLKDAPILILDEPTSALDAQTEHDLMQALERLMAGRTTFVIAHRLSTIRSADRIYVMEDGQVVEFGTHVELLARGSAYAAMSGAAAPTQRAAVRAEALETGR